MKGIRAEGVYLKVISMDIGVKTIGMAKITEKMKTKGLELVFWRKTYI